MVLPLISPLWIHSPHTDPRPPPPQTLVIHAVCFWLNFPRKADAVSHIKVHTLEMNEVCEWQNPLKNKYNAEVDPGGHAYQISCGIQLFFL